jgi:chloramphenicol-sensitive protein RarD
VGDSLGPRYRSGVAFGLVAYLWWGLVPLYFAALKAAAVPALEILAHRIAWSLPVLFLFTAVAGGWADLFRVIRDRRLLLILLASSIFLAGNWLMYIYATVTGRVTEASLGYYMLPLVNAALATAFLGERLRPLHYPALALVAIGVSIPFLAAGTFTWLAVSLPVSFGIYGVIRKQAPVESMTGLTVESLLMLPPSLAYLMYLTAGGSNHFSGDWGTKGLIAFSGVVTVIPLLTFTLSIRRLPLLAISFIQFLSPTVQMVIAVWLLNEPLTGDHIAAFICVWLAVAIFVADAVWQARRGPGRVFSEDERQPDKRSGAINGESVRIPD